jgi:hypothetical protein
MIGVCRVRQQAGSSKQQGIKKRHGPLQPVAFFYAAALSG